MFNIPENVVFADMEKVVICETLEQFKKDCLDWAKSKGVDTTYKSEEHKIDLSMWDLYARDYVSEKWCLAEFTYSTDKNPVYIITNK